MKHPLYILSLALMLLSSVLAYGQTPFDTFSPETSRPILDGDSIAAWRAEQKVLNLRFVWSKKYGLVQYEFQNGMVYNRTWLR